MKRSFARSAFKSPLACSSLQNHVQNQNPSNAPKLDDTNRSLEAVLELFHNKDLESTENSKDSEPGTAASCIKKDICDTKDPSSLMFSVLWAKSSNRKHKRWEGDALLIVSGKSVVLKALESDDILARGSGYQLQQLANLECGSRLFLGEKEIEIQNVLNDGSCKVNMVAPQERVSSVLKAPFRRSSPSTKRPFSVPLKDGQSTTFSFKPRTALPLHGNSFNTVFYMPKPTNLAFRVLNSSNMSLVDVIVDAHLAGKLRPHQMQGVTFLYECLLGFKTHDILSSFAESLFENEDDVFSVVRDGEKEFYGAILADDMGLGKSLQTIAIIWTLLKQGPYGRPTVNKVLIVCPSSLTNNWASEFKKWLGDVRLQPLIIMKDVDVKLFGKSPLYPVTIISYELFVRLYSLLENVPVDLLVCDEGHRLKNRNIKSNMLLTSLSVKRRILLAGTPVQNNLQELYALCDFVNPGCLGDPSLFRCMFEDPITTMQSPNANETDRVIGEKRAACLRNVTASFILRRTQEINNQYLPSKIEYVVFCQPSQLQLDLYKCIIGFQSASRKPLQPLSCINMLRKICNHPFQLLSVLRDSSQLMASDCVTTDGDEVLSIEETLKTDLLNLLNAEIDMSASVTDSGKLSTLCQLFASLQTHCPSEKIVVVSNYTQTLDMIESICTASQYSCLRLDGSTPSSHRQKLVEQFNSDRCFVFLLSCKAGGTGFNLVGASRLVLYDPDWNPANDLQALARVWRDGQNKRVYLYRFITTGTIEEKIYQRQVKKQELSGLVVDDQAGFSQTVAKKGKITEYANFTEGELKDIFTLHENPLGCQTHELLKSCSCRSDLINDSVNKPTSSCAKEPNEIDCQIRKGGQLFSDLKKRVSMAELLKWEHLLPPFKGSSEHCLTSSSITMVFRNIVETSQ